jgi:nucleoside-diphosphate-sugar epimerase
MAFTRFTRSAALGEEISIYGSGDQIRDFTFVEDIVEANVLAATKAVDHGAVLNVAGGSNVSVNEVLKILESVADKELRVTYGPPVAGDVFRTGGSTVAIREVLGWSPRHSLEDGLAAQYEWAKRIVAS